MIFMRESTSSASLCTERAASPISAMVFAGVGADRSEDVVELRGGVIEAGGAGADAVIFVGERSGHALDVRHRAVDAFGFSSISLLALSERSPSFSPMRCADSSRFWNCDGSAWIVG